MGTIHSPQFAQGQLYHKEIKYVLGRKDFVA